MKLVTKVFIPYDSKIATQISGAPGEIVRFMGSFDVQYLGIWVPTYDRDFEVMTNEVVWC